MEEIFGVATDSLMGGMLGMDLKGIRNEHIQNYNENPRRMPG